MSFSFLALARENVTFIAFVALDLTIAGNAKSFRRRSISFNFGHFFTPLIFLFAVSVERSLWRQEHRHVSSLQPWFDVDFSNIEYLTDNAPEHLSAQFRMRDFSTAKENRYFDSLAFPDKLTNVSDLMLDVVGVGARAHFHFFDLDYRMLFRPMGFLFLLVAKFAVIHHAAHGRLRVRSHFNQIELLGFHLFERLVQWQYSQLLALRSDHPHFARANLMIDPRFPSYRPPPCPV